MCEVRLALPQGDLAQEVAGPPPPAARGVRRPRRGAAQPGSRAATPASCTRASSTRRCSTRRVLQQVRHLPAADGLPRGVADPPVLHRRPRHGGGRLRDDPQGDLRQRTAPSRTRWSRPPTARPCALHRPDADHRAASSTSSPPTSPPAATSPASTGAATPTSRCASARRSRSASCRTRRGCHNEANPLLHLPRLRRRADRGPRRRRLRPV